MTDVHAMSLSRRNFLRAGAAMVGASALPLGAPAQGPRFRRLKATDPKAARDLASYKAGVSKMLNLPPTDPRNWYRNALVHLLDCPHGNWWFLVWHRAYLGWLERTVRDLSGDPEFALPYWDWTEATYVPAQMFDGALNPCNEPFLASFGAFRKQFEPAIAAYYASLSSNQKAQLALRPIRMTTPAEFWNVVMGRFSNQAEARGLTASRPDLDDLTQVTVRIDMIRNALRTPTFAGGAGQPAGFQSAKAAHHSTGAGEGILESQPHDNVHGAVGGFMGRHLSSVDPIFYMHHANLDRLWEVWTRKHAAFGRPTLPQGADLDAWSNEQFLFFTDATGRPVSKTRAGDYTTMRVFDYDYAPGSGEDEVPTPTATVAVAPTQVFRGKARSASGGRPAGATVEVPAAALMAASSPGAAPRVAEITLNLTHADEGRQFRVLVLPGAAAASVPAGAIAVFGHHHGPTTFTVPLSETVGGAAAAGTVPLDIQVVPIGPPLRGATAHPQVSAIQVRTN